MSDVDMHRCRCIESLFIEACHYLRARGAPGEMVHMTRVLVHNLSEGWATVVGLALRGSAERLQVVQHLHDVPVLVECDGLEQVLHRHAEHGARGQEASDVL
eukprot:scaffold86223_cov62-Phaeocystis_antarctica.AAC.4